MKYKKKPVVIEDVQGNGNNAREVFDFLTDGTIEYITPDGDNFYVDHNTVNGGLIIETLECNMAANIGDYIIKGIACKPDIFKSTYEEVVE